MKLARALCLFMGLYTAGVFAAYSAEAPGGELKTLAVAAFKNGLSFVVKQGDVRLEEGAARIAPIPFATLGDR